MSRYLDVTCMLICCALAGPTALAADPPAPLRHNPFTRPDLGQTAAARGAAPQPVAWEQELRATLVAGPDSLANIGGKLYAVGEDVDGYRLTQVGEGFVVLEKADRTITLLIGTADESDKE